MSDAFTIVSIIAGIGVGVIVVGATLIFSHFAEEPHTVSRDEDRRNYERRNRIKRCFKCKNKKDSPFFCNLICGDIVHESCFYEMLVRCSVTELKMYRCPSCDIHIPYPLLKRILCSKCGVCKKDFDRNIHTLTCGHRLHKKCLYADKVKQEVLRTMYKCPYNLLECDQEMAFHSLPDFRDS